MKISQLIKLCCLTLIGGLLGAVLMSLWKRETEAIDTKNAIDASLSIIDEKISGQTTSRGAKAQQRHSESGIQARMVKRFLEAYAANPSALPDLLVQLYLPEPLRSDIVSCAVAQSISLKTDETLMGIEALAMKNLKVPLLVKAFEELSKTDPVEANLRAIASPYPEALAGVALEYWKHSPKDAMKQLSLSKPEQQSVIIPGLVFSDISIDERDAKNIHEMIKSLAAQGDMSAAASEGAILRKCLATDIKYVEQYLDSKDSLVLRDQVAPELALAKCNGQWEKANEWLENYQENAVTPATYELWRRWAGEDTPGIISFLTSSSNEDTQEKMLSYFRGLGLGNEGANVVIDNFGQEPE